MNNNHPRIFFSQHLLQFKLNTLAAFRRLFVFFFPFNNSTSTKHLLCNIKQMDPERKYAMHVNVFLLSSLLLHLSPNVFLPPSSKLRLVLNYDRKPAP